MSARKHSPIPWRLGYRDGSGMGTIITEKRERTEYGLLPKKEVARLHWGCSCCDSGADAMSEEDKANADLIVRAVNSHAELLEALEGLMTDLSGGPKKCGHDFSCVCAGDAARAEIAKAKGEGQ